MNPCPIPSCRRKYKTTKRLQQHVRDLHIFDTQNSNRYQITRNTAMKIFKLAAKYARILLSGTPDQQAECAKNLFPQKKDITQDELKTMIDAQTQFTHRIYACDWEKVMSDFEGFIRLGIPYNDTNFCPSLPIDFLWHALMQDPVLYSQVCCSSIGRIIPHCNTMRTEEEDIKRYDYFSKVFQHKIGREVYLPSKHEPLNVDAFDVLVAKYEAENEKHTKAENEELKQIIEKNNEQVKIAEAFCGQVSVPVSFLVKHVNHSGNKYVESFLLECCREKYVSEGLIGSKMVDYINDVIRAHHTVRPHSTC